MNRRITKKHIHDGIPDDQIKWEPEKFRYVKLSPLQIKWNYWKLYRYLDLETMFHWVLDRIRARRLLVVYKLEGYAVEKMAHAYKQHEESIQARRSSAVKRNKQSK